MKGLGYLFIGAFNVFLAGMFTGGALAGQGVEGFALGLLMLFKGATFIGLCLVMNRRARRKKQAC